MEGKNVFSLPLSLLHFFFSVWLYPPISVNQEKNIDRTENPSFSKKSEVKDAYFLSDSSVFGIYAPGF